MKAPILNPFERAALDVQMRKARAAGAAQAEHKKAVTYAGRGRGIVLRGSKAGDVTPKKREHGSIVGKVLDSNGQWRAPLAPRATGSIHIQGAAAGRADQDRREALRRGSIGPKGGDAPVLPRPPGEGGGEGLRPAGSARSCDALGVCQHRPGMGGACACESGFASTGAVTNADANAGAHAKASGAALPRGRRGAKAAGHTQAAAGAENALAGVLKAPADLWAFLQAVPVAEGARALGVSRRQVQRLLAGYWPGNAGALLAAWGAYKGRVAAQQSRWVLRCVSASGCVSYAGARWGAVQLLARCGQAVAVARVDGQRLLVQTLDLPGQRFELHGL